VIGFVVIALAASGLGQDRVDGGEVSPEAKVAFEPLGEAFAEPAKFAARARMGVRPDINSADVRTSVFQLLGRPVRPCALLPATDHAADHPSVSSPRRFGSVTERDRLGEGPNVVSA